MIPNLVLSLDLGTRGPTEVQWWFAAVVAALFVAVGLYVAYRIRYAGLSWWQIRHMKSLWASEVLADCADVVVYYNEPRETQVEKIRSLFESRTVSDNRTGDGESESRFKVVFGTPSIPRSIPSRPWLQHLPRIAAKFRSVFLPAGLSMVIFFASLLAGAHFSGAELVPSLVFATGVVLVVTFVVNFVTFVRSHVAKSYYRRSKPSRAYLEGYEVEDAVGRRYYVVCINGDQRFMSPEDSLDVLVSDVRDALDEYWESDEVPMTLCEYQYDRATGFGLVDFEDNEAAARNEARLHVLSSLLFNDGRLSETKLFSETESIPEHILREELDDLEERRKVRDAGRDIVLIDEELNGKRARIDRVVQKLF